MPLLFLTVLLPVSTGGALTTTSSPRSLGLGFVFGARDTVGVISRTSRRGLGGTPTRREVLAASDALLRALAASGVRLPPVRTYARVARSGPRRLPSYTLPFDVDPAVYPWFVRVKLAPVLTGRASALERGAEFVAVSAPCGAGAVEMVVSQGVAGIDVFRPVSGGHGLLCEGRDDAGAYRVTEQPASAEGSGGHCGWTFHPPGAPPGPAECDDAGRLGGQELPLAELLASGRPVFEALASVQRTSCGEPPSP